MKVNPHLINWFNATYPLLALIPLNFCDYEYFSGLTLQPNYSISTRASQNLDKLEKAQLLFSLFPLDSSYSQALLRKRSSACYQALANMAAVMDTPESISLALSYGGKANPPEASAFALSLTRAEKYLVNIEGAWKPRQLLKAHEILCRNWGDTELKSGALREDEKPQEPWVASFPNASPTSLAAFLESLCSWLEQSNAKPWIEAWLLYLYLGLASPFDRSNLQLALIAARSHLKRNATLSPDLAQVEAELEKNWEAHLALAKNDLFAHDFNLLINADHSQYLEHCLLMSQNALHGLLTEHESLYKDQIDFKSLSPRAKNRVRYLFDIGFEKHAKTLATLSDRQLRLTEQLALNGPVHTKPMFMLFKCDRKTIQRDFQVLMNTGIAYSRGKTKTTQYYLNMQ